MLRQALVLVFQQEVFFGAGLHGVDVGADGIGRVEQAGALVAVVPDQDEHTDKFQHQKHKKEVVSIDEI